MYRARDIAQAFEQIAPLNSGVPGDELGFIHGDPEAPVRALACVWNVHAQSLRACVALDANLLICHEGLWLPAQTSPWYQGPGKDQIHANQVRRQLLDQHQLTVYRSHSNWDALAGNGVPDQALAALGLAGLRTVARQRFFTVQELPAVMTAATLGERVGQGLGYPACRVFGDRGKPVRRFAFLIGGFGENQWHMPQAARDLGAEALILGEMSEFIVIACLEMGLPVIESLHSASEIPAIKRQAALLQARFPDLPVHYVPSGALSFA